METGEKSASARPPRKSKSAQGGNPPPLPDWVKGTPQPYVLRHYDRWAERRFGRLTPYFFRCFYGWAQRLSKEEEPKNDLAKQIGRGMRFFLNSAVFWIIVYSLALAITLRPLSLESLLLAGLPILISVPFFLLFLLMLKRIEAYAAKRRNIDLVSRSIWELNKSALIRRTVGKIPTFIKE
jgi:hypothetical protein